MKRKYTKIGDLLKDEKVLKDCICIISENPYNLTRAFKIIADKYHCSFSTISNYYYLKQYNSPLYKKGKQMKNCFMLIGRRSVSNTKNSNSKPSFQTISLWHKLKQLIKRYE